MCEKTIHRIRRRETAKARGVLHLQFSVKSETLLRIRRQQERADSYRRNHREA